MSQAYPEASATARRSFRVGTVRDPFRHRLQPFAGVVAVARHPDPELGRPAGCRAVADDRQRVRFPEPDVAGHLVVVISLHGRLLLGKGLRFPVDPDKVPRVTGGFLLEIPAGLLSSAWGGRPPDREHRAWPSDMSNLGGNPFTRIFEPFLRLVLIGLCVLLLAVLILGYAGTIPAVILGIVFLFLVVDMATDVFRGDLERGVSTGPRCVPYGPAGYPLPGSPGTRRAAGSSWSTRHPSWST